ncbi:MAG TPA: hypothetical protein VIS72_13260 [Anaerolineales bacterium]
MRGSDGIYPPDEANEIPKGAEFGILAFFVPFKVPMNQYDGLEVNIFLDKLLDFTLYLDVDNETYKYRYSPKKVKQNVDQLLGGTFPKPRVTKKEKMQ